MIIKNILLTLLIIITISPLVSAEYLPHKQNTELSFSITSNNGTQCNVSSYDYPNGTIYDDNPSIVRNFNLPLLNLTIAE